MMDQNAGGFETSTLDDRSRPHRRRPLRLLGSLLVLLLLIYLASPYYSFWRFTQVLRSNDRSRMEQYVDFRSVRDSLKQQLRAKVPLRDESQSAERKQDPFAGLVERLAPALIDQLVDAFVTPDGLAALIADPQVAREAKEKNPGALSREASGAGKDAAREFGWGDVRYAFFTGPRDFLIDVHGTKLRYRFSKFHWLLQSVELPLDNLKL
ncbi:MAG: DUF2939 domain-containing protein [Chthoniobacterales bacterium]